jgi:outer membrane protein assembly factor BamB
MFISPQCSSLAAAFCAILTFAAAAADWPQWRGPAANGVSAEAAWTHDWAGGKPKTLWQAELGYGFSSVAVADGRVYTTGNTDDSDTVYCLDAATGKQLWTHSYPCKRAPTMYEGGPNATPAVAAGDVYVASREGHVFCLAADTGAVRWQTNISKHAKKPKFGFSGSALVLADRLILNVGAGGMALDRKSGKPLWTSEGLGGYATAVPVPAAGRTAVAIFGGKGITAVDSADGRQLWSFPWPTKYSINAADPIVRDDTILIASGYNQGSALLKFSADGVKAVWQGKTFRSHFNPGVLVGGHVYGFDGNSHQRAGLQCIEYATGKVAWSESTFGFGSVLLVGERLLMLTAKGDLVVATPSPAGYEELARANVLSGKCWTAPALSDGRVYARNATGTLVCVDVSAKK